MDQLVLIKTIDATDEYPLSIDSMVEHPLKAHSVLLSGVRVKRSDCYEMSDEEDEPFLGSRLICVSIDRL